MKVDENYLIGLIEVNDGITHYNHDNEPVRLCLLAVLSQWGHYYYTH